MVEQAPVDARFPSSYSSSSSCSSRRASALLIALLTIATLDCGAARPDRTAGSGGDMAPVGTGGRGSGGAGGSAGRAGVGGAPAWTLVWSDEFDGPSGSAPDATRWSYDIGGDGWGNGELQYYTSRPANVALDGAGHLSIVAAAEPYLGRAYTSARIKTQGRFAQAYGRFEARVQIPRGQGLWPAFWMLGADLATNLWPACGEIDILENVGREPSINHGSLHGPGYSGGNPLTGTYTLPTAAALADEPHLYAVEWEAGAVRFYVDDTLYETRSPSDVPSGARWVFDHPFFMILNVAVGGTLPGAPDRTTVLPQKMLVDYVRVYARR